MYYRLPNDSAQVDRRNMAPLQDAQQAIRLVRKNANLNGILIHGKVGIMGFSAGGHLAATAAQLILKRLYR